MTTERIGYETQRVGMPNGAGAAAVLAMGLGSFVMAILAIIADRSVGFKKMMVFYTPTGPLSGVTTTAVVVWLVSWIALDIAWRNRSVSKRILTAGLCLLAISFALMFPPIGDLF